MATLDLQYRVYKNPGQAQKQDRDLECSWKRKNYKPILLPV